MSSLIYKAVFCIGLFALSGCAPYKSSSDIFETAGLSSQAADCLRSCETDTIGPSANDRAKACACDCHHKFNTGRHRQFCDESHLSREENINTIHDNVNPALGL